MGGEWAAIDPCSVSSCKASCVPVCPAHSQAPSAPTPGTPGCKRVALTAVQVAKLLPDLCHTPSATTLLQPVLHRFAPTVENSGLEGFTMEFDWSE
jgi:hypothetical protein